MGIGEGGVGGLGMEREGMWLVGGDGELGIIDADSRGGSWNAALRNC
jgi:hypothetical protein